MIDQLLGHLVEMFSASTQPGFPNIFAMQLAVSNNCAAPKRRLILLLPRLVYRCRGRTVSVDELIVFCVADLSQRRVWFRFGK